MSNNKSGAYGQGGGGDTDFRRTWDRDEMDKRFREREAREREEGKARAEAKAQGKTYHRPASIAPEDAKATEARTLRFDPTSMIGKTMLVPAGATGKRGRGAGIYCSACDLTFRSNLEWIEHQNSKSHLIAIGETGEVVRATLEDVRSRLVYLARKRKEASKGEELNLDKRLDQRREEEEREREEKRRKRNEKRRSKKKQDDW